MNVRPPPHPGVLGLTCLGVQGAWVARHKRPPRARTISGAWRRHDGDSLITVTITTGEFGQKGSALAPASHVMRFLVLNIHPPHTNAHAPAGSATAGPTGAGTRSMASTPSPTSAWPSSTRTPAPSPSSAPTARVRRWIGGWGGRLTDAAPRGRTPRTLAL